MDPIVFPFGGQRKRHPLAQDQKFQRLSNSFQDSDGVPASTEIDPDTEGAGRPGGLSPADRPLINPTSDPPGLAGGARAFRASMIQGATGTAIGMSARFPPHRGPLLTRSGSSGCFPSIALIIIGWSLRYQEFGGEEQTTQAYAHGRTGENRGRRFRSDSIDY